MSIKIRLALLLGLLLVAFLISLALLRRIESEQLERMLANSQRDGIELMERWLDLTGQSLRQFANDYSLWDDMVSFVNHPDPAWARINLAESLPNFNAYAAWVLGADGSLLYATRAGDGPPLPPPLDPAALRALAADTPFFHFYATAGQELLEIRGAPIQPSADSARSTSPRGWLLTARLWDDAYLQTLARLTESTTRLTAPGESVPKADGQATIALLRPLNDWQGRTLRTLHIQRVVPDLTQILHADAFEARIFVGFGLLVIVALGLSLQRWVLQPLGWIGESLARSDPAPIRPLLRERTELSRVALLIESSFAQREALVREIEERRRAEEALRHSEGMLRRTIDERARLGRDLHDGVIQSIYAAGMGLAATRSLLHHDIAEAEQRLDQVRSALNETIRDLRNFITGLEPEALKHHTFRQAVGALIDFLQAIGPIQVEVAIDEARAEQLPPGARTDALQIIREAMSNSLRHGNAQHICISLQQDTPGSLRLAISDDGSGFNPAAPATRGHGLNNMAERARASGATFIIESTPGKGTRIIVTFPLPEDIIT
ncbi:MAG TPA: CHASE4 domain-containing protein [Opitutaceae bacterium]